MRLASRPCLRTGMTPTFGRTRRLAWPPVMSAHAHHHHRHYLPDSRRLGPGDPRLRPPPRTSGRPAATRPVGRRPPHALLPRPGLVGRARPSTAPTCCTSTSGSSTTTLTSWQGSCASSAVVASRWSSPCTTCATRTTPPRTCTTPASTCWCPPRTRSSRSRRSPPPRSADAGDRSAMVLPHPHVAELDRIDAAASRRAAGRYRLATALQVVAAEHGRRPVPRHDGRRRP